MEMVSTYLYIQPFISCPVLLCEVRLKMPVLRSNVFFNGRPWECAWMVSSGACNFFLKPLFVVLSPTFASLDTPFCLVTCQIFFLSTNPTLSCDAVWQRFVVKFVKGPRYVFYGAACQRCCVVPFGHRRSREEPMDHY